MMLFTKNKKNVTVNDVLFMMISQALHDYWKKEEDDIMLESKGGRSLVQQGLITCSITSRPETDDKSRALRNLWCFISCDLSVGTGTTITSTSSSGGGGDGDGDGDGTNQQNQIPILDRLRTENTRTTLLAVLKKGLAWSHLFLL